MVKRAKSPDATDDTRYMTVYQPYPMNANWELPSDIIAFAFWIAGCIGVEPLLGLHYKPKARGMVLLEIDKAYPEHERLLGEHRWIEFLKNPRADEKERISQIFYCLYHTGRAAQKDGWKRIHVESHWFKDWSPNNGLKEFRRAHYWEFDNLSGLSTASTAVWGYKGTVSDAAFMDVNTSLYSQLCTTEVDLSHLKPSHKSVNASTSTYYKVDYELIMLFGGTELKAQLAWKEHVVEKRSAVKIVYSD